MILDQINFVIFLQRVYASLRIVKILMQKHQMDMQYMQIQEMKKILFSQTSVLIESDNDIILIP